MGNTKSIQETEAEIVEEFSLFDSWDDKYEYIIDLGKKLLLLEDEYKKDENKVRGCQSTVWLVADYKDGRVYFKAESDAVIVKGLISMLIRVLSGHTPDEIINAKLDFINQIGMTSHLAQTRSNGLLAMVKQMKNYALAFKCLPLTQGGGIADTQTLLNEDASNDEVVSISEAMSAGQAPSLGGGWGEAALKDKIIEKLQTIYDPEIPVSIYELGLIYEVSILPINNVQIVMTLTAPSCPAAQTIPVEVDQKLREIEGVNDVHVAVTWTPPWDKSMMSEAAQLELGFL